MAKKVSKTKETEKPKIEIKALSKKVSPIEVALAYHNSNLDEDFLKKAGFDPSRKKIEVSKNLVIVNGLIDYHLEVKDEKADLDGNPFENNEKVINRIIKIWKAGKNTIGFDELINLNVFTPK